MACAEAAQFLPALKRILANKLFYFIPLNLISLVKKWHFSGSNTSGLIIVRGKSRCSYAFLKVLLTFCVLD